MESKMLVSLVVAGAVLTGSAVHTSHAQSTRVAASSTAVASSLALVRITLDVRNATLEHVLDDIARQAGLKPVYGGLVSNVSERVKLKLEKVTVQEAFARALDGTNLRAAIVNRNVLFEPVQGAVVRADGTIVGTVVSAKSKQPVAGATVTVGDVRAVTDGSGRFRVVVSAGDHQVAVRAVGYGRLVQAVVAEDGKTATVTLELQPNVSVLDEVVVTGTVIATERKAIATPITVITAEDIEKRGITRIDELLRGEVPGVLAIDQGSGAYTDVMGLAGSQVYSRGASSIMGDVTPLKIYIDGVEITDPLYLSTIDPEIIDRLEIVSGPQAATIYGSGALGGVMQIFTKTGRGQTPEVQLNLQYGMLQNSMSNGVTPTHNHSLNMRGSRGQEFSYSGNLSYQYTGQWQPEMFTRAASSMMGGTYDLGWLLVSGSMVVSRNTNGTTSYEMRSLLAYPRGKAGAALPGVVEPGLIWVSFDPPVVASARIMKTINQTQSLNVDWRPFSVWQHHVTLGRSDVQQHLVPQRPVFRRASDSLARTEERNTQRFSLNYNTTVSPVLGPVSFTGTLGASGAWGEEYSLRNACLDVIDDTQVVSCTSTRGVDLQRRPLNSGWGGFINSRIGFYDQLFVSMALRGESNKTYGSSNKIDWTPTLGMTYSHVFGNITLKGLASYGWATRPPPWGYRDEQWTYASSSSLLSVDFISRFANPSLGPEYSRGPQGGVEIYFGNVGAFTLNHYRQQVTDLLYNMNVDSIQGVYEINPGLWTRQSQWQNLGTLRTIGWDGTGSITVGPLSIKGTYSWTDSRIKIKPCGPGYVCSSDPEPSFQYLPMHTANLVFSYSHAATSVTATNNWTGGTVQQWSYTLPGQIRSRARLPVYNDVVKSSAGVVPKSGYWRTNVTASHRVSYAVSATLGIQNIGNSFDSDAGELFPALGRQTRVGVSVRFPNR